MSSPVDTSVVYSHHQMSGAPVLRAQAGSFIALTDAILINGFDTKAADSISILNGVATVTFTGAHSSEQQSVILVSGATGAFVDLNGRQKVTARVGSTLTFSTLLPNGTATGTISFLMAPAGWTKVFAGTNLAAYRSPDPLANGHFLRVDDTDNASIRVRGYETMSDINTGTGLFPTDAQLSLYSVPANTSGGYWYKGSTVSTNPVGWTFTADNRFFMFCPQTQQSQLNVSFNVLGHFKGFGDPVVTRPSGDAYSTIIGTGGTAAQGSPQGGSFSQGDTSSGAVYAARSYTGLGGSELTSVLSYSKVNIPNEGVSGAATGELGRFPSVIDGSLRFSQKFIRRTSPPTDAESVARANIPGILHIPMTGVFASLPPKTIIDGTGFLTGRKLVTVGIGSPSTDTAVSPDGSGIVLIDITGPWR
jgi:hypothetical protein